MIAKRRIFAMISLFILITFLCACSKSPNTSESLPSYLDLEQLHDGYGVENAVDDRCVVFEDSKLISGEEIWKRFLSNVKEKKSCFIRIAMNYNKDNTLCLVDLSYEDLSFNIKTNDGLSKQYKYLNHYELETKNNDSDHSQIDCYILMNQENITYEEFERSLASSIYSDAIDHYIVYYNIS